MLVNCDLNTSIPDWIIDYPETADVFEQLQLDTSCAGKSLDYLCYQRGLCPSVVLQMLKEVIQSGRPSGRTRSQREDDQT